MYISLVITTQDYLCWNFEPLCFHVLNIAYKNETYTSEPCNTFVSSSSCCWCLFVCFFFLWVSQGLLMKLLIWFQCSDSLQNLESLNLNGCQKISDKGIEAITTVCFNLKVFSIYWNVRVSDIGIKHLVKNCKRIVNLNLSGCKNITDKSLQLVADNYQYLESLNLTRCIKITDGGLCQILLKCSSLQSLNLYALSSFTDEAYKKISILVNLRFLDLCGSQNLTNEGLYCIAKCKNLASLNLTWCVRVTDEGVIAIAQGCISLEFLSLFGIIGVTDKCLEALSRFCSNTLTTLDVNGCIGIKRRSREELLQLFPHLRCFKVHS